MSWIYWFSALSAATLLIHFFFFFNKHLQKWWKSCFQFPIIKAYFATKPVLLAQQQCRKDLGRNNVPDRRTIQCLVAKFWEKGSVADDHICHSGQHCSAIIPGNIQNLWKRLEEFSRKSTHLLSQETGEEKGSRYEHSYLPTRWSSTPLLRQIFGSFGWYFPDDKLILRHTNFPGPPYSHDLKPCDYFL